MGGGGEHASYPKGALAQHMNKHMKPWRTMPAGSGTLALREHKVTAVCRFAGVWSPAGGWWADPVHWRRNTALAFLCVLRQPQASRASRPCFLRFQRVSQRDCVPGVCRGIAVIAIPVFYKSAELEVRLIPTLSVAAVVAAAATYLLLACCV